jgi:putative MFS transporter
MTGVGLSAMTVVASAYTMEYFPAVSRGKILSMIVAISLIGIPATAWVARAVVPIGEHGWRFIFVWGALGILVVPASISKLSESPRWLFLHDEQERANGIVEQLEAVALQRYGSLPPLKTGTLPRETVKVSYRQLLNSQYRSRFIVVTLMSICSALGFYGFIAWVPTLLVQHGFSVVKSLSYSSMMAICNPLGALLAMTVIERIERKYFIVMAAVCISVVVTLYGWTSNPVFIVIFGALAVMCLQGSTVGVWTYQSECFPTEVRSGATGFVYGVGRMANIVGPFIVSGLYGAFGYYSVFFYIAVCYLAGGAIAAIFGPRTTGRALEDIGEAHAASADESRRNDDVGSVNTRSLS